MATAAPWDGVPADHQLFVLVTGANSGIGLGIAQRLIDDFIDERPADHHLVLLTTTRSAAKSRATRDALRLHVAGRSITPRSRGRRPRPTLPARIHLASLELDLCNLRSVYAAADQLVRGTVRVSTEMREAEAVRVPRLDAVVCNAGMGGWTGLSWGALLRDVLAFGIVQATTFPTSKLATVGLRVDPLTGKSVAPLADKDDQRVDKEDDDDDTTLGQVFCANVFGHYVLAHQLLPLLRRDAAAAQLSGSGQGLLPPARLVWESSVEAVSWANLNPDDLQGLRTHAAYESSKRLTDVLALTTDLPGVRPFSHVFLGVETSDADTKDTDTDVVTLLTHPGVVCSTLFPLSWFLFYLYNIGMYVTRWLGSPWHPVTAYAGACAAVWAVLQPPAALAARDATRVKWGASATRCGATRVKKTEVEGWGWTGALAQDQDLDALDPFEAREPAAAQLRPAVGRRRGATALTAERRQEFEVLGRACWQEMERLRLLWDGRVRASESKA